MNDIKIGSIISGILAVWYFINRFLGELSKIVEPLILTAEQCALDGQIDRKDRKIIVMKAIALLEQEKKIKLNFITRFIVSKIVDFIAKKLPDFTISEEALDLIEKSK